MSDVNPPPGGGAPPPPPPPGGGTPPPPPPGGGTPPPPPYGQAPVPGMAPDGRMYAEWVWRVIAYLIDDIAVIVVNIIAYVFYLMAFSSSYELVDTGYGYTYPVYTSSFNFFPFLIALILWLAGLIFYFWNKGFKEGTTGKSIGKGMTGYTTVDEATGEPLGAGKGCLRALLLFVDFWICYIGVLWPLWDAKRQCLISDKATNAVVFKDAV